MIQPQLVANDLRRSFRIGSRRIEVLRGISLSVAHGEAVFLCGASGAGKTTLLYTLAGLERPESGTVEFEGYRLYTGSASSQARLRNKKMGFVFQGYFLLPELTALENVMLPGMISGNRKRVVAEASLSDVGLAERLHHLPAELSGGEQQRVAIARALTNDPDIVFADEPTGNLDSKTGDAIIDLLLQVVRSRKKTLLVVHGLSLGSLSLMGCESFTEGFGPLMEGFETRVALDDIGALERELSKRDVAAFVIEPVQGKGCQSPKTDFFQRAQDLCQKHGTMFICDEIQTGLGRTGKMFGFEHWDLEPDIITLAKSLSGGYVPCGAIVMRRGIYQKTFSRMDRCVVHSTTFGRNNLAMACGLAALDVIDDEKLVENSARVGAHLLERIGSLRAKHSFIKEVRGKGLIIAIEFHEPTEFKLKMGWKLLHKVDKVLFAQMVVTQMLSKHRILTQVAGHAMDVVKILPPLIIGEKEAEMFVSALDDVLTECRKFPGPMWEIGNNFVRHALGSKRPAATAV